MQTTVSFAASVFGPLKFYSVGEEEAEITTTGIDLYEYFVVNVRRRREVVVLAQWKGMKKRYKNQNDC